MYRVTSSLSENVNDDVFRSLRASGINIAIDSDHRPRPHPLMRLNRAVMEAAAVSAATRVLRSDARYGTIIDVGSNAVRIRGHLEAAGLQPHELIHTMPRRIPGDSDRREAARRAGLHFSGNILTEQTVDWHAKDKDGFYRVPLFIHSIYYIDAATLHALVRQTRVAFAVVHRTTSGVLVYSNDKKDAVVEAQWETEGGVTRMNVRGNAQPYEHPALDLSGFIVDELLTWTIPGVSDSSQLAQLIRISLPDEPEEPPMGAEADPAPGDEPEEDTPEVLELEAPFDPRQVEGYADSVASIVCAPAKLRVARAKNQAAYLCRRNRADWSKVELSAMFDALVSDATDIGSHATTALYLGSVGTRERILTKVHELLVRPPELAKETRREAIARAALLAEDEVRTSADTVSKALSSLWRFSTMTLRAMLIIMVTYIVVKILRKHAMSPARLYNAWRGRIGDTIGWYRMELIWNGVGAPIQNACDAIAGAVHTIRQSWTPMAIKGKQPATQEARPPPPRPLAGRQHIFVTSCTLGTILGQPEVLPPREKAQPPPATEPAQRPAEVSTKKKQRRRRKAKPAPTACYILESDKHLAYAAYVSNFELLARCWMPKSCQEREYAGGDYASDDGLLSCRVHNAYPVCQAKRVDTYQPWGPGLPVATTVFHQCDRTRAAAVIGRFIHARPVAERPYSVTAFEIDFGIILGSDAEFVEPDLEEWAQHFPGAKGRAKSEALMQTAQAGRACKLMVKGEVTAGAITGAQIGIDGRDQPLGAKLPRPVVFEEDYNSSVYGPAYWSWSKTCARSVFCREVMPGLMMTYAIGLTSDQLGAMHTQHETFVGPAAEMDEFDFGSYDSSIPAEAREANINLMKARGWADMRAIEAACANLISWEITSKTLEAKMKAAMGSGHSDTTNTNTLTQLAFWLEVHRRAHLVDRSSRLAVGCGGDDGTNWSNNKSLYRTVAIALAKERGMKLVPAEIAEGFYSGLWVPCPVHIVDTPNGGQMPAEYALLPKPGRAWVKSSWCRHPYGAAKLRSWAAANRENYKDTWTDVPVLRVLLECMPELNGHEHEKVVARVKLDSLHKTHMRRKTSGVNWGYWTARYGLSREVIEEFESRLRTLNARRVVITSRHPLLAQLVAESGFDYDDTEDAIGKIPIHNPWQVDELIVSDIERYEGITTRVVPRLAGTAIEEIVVLALSAVTGRALGLRALDAHIIVAWIHASLEVSTALHGRDTWRAWSTALAYKILSHMTLALVRVYGGPAWALLFHLAHNALVWSAYEVEADALLLFQRRSLTPARVMTNTRKKQGRHIERLERKLHRDKVAEGQLEFADTFGRMLSADRLTHRYRSNRPDTVVFDCVAEGTMTADAAGVFTGCFTVDPDFFACVYVGSTTVGDVSAVTSDASMRQLPQLNAIRGFGGSIVVKRVALAFTTAQNYTTRQGLITAGYAIQSPAAVPTREQIARLPEHQTRAISALPAMPLVVPGYFHKQNTIEAVPVVGGSGGVVVETIPYDPDAQIPNEGTDPSYFVPRHLGRPKILVGATGMAPGGTIYARVTYTLEIMPANGMYPVNDYHHFNYTEDEMRAMVSAVVASPGALDNVEHMEPINADFDDESNQPPARATATKDGRLVLAKTDMEGRNSVNYTPSRRSERSQSLRDKGDLMLRKAFGLDKAPEGFYATTMANAGRPFQNAWSALWDIIDLGETAAEDPTVQKAGKALGDAALAL